MTRTTPLRRMTLHLTQIFFTDARTFIGPPERGSGRALAPEKRAPLKTDLAPHPNNRRRGRGQPDTKGAASIAAASLSVKWGRTEGGRASGALDEGPQAGPVSTTGPFSVTAIVCSKCAEFLPSFVTTVHPSLNVRTSCVRMSSGP